MLPSKSREHRIRVLENLAEGCWRAGDAGAGRQGDAQMRMPLVVEVKSSLGTKQRVRRSRGGSRKNQPELGDL